MGKTTEKLVKKAFDEIGDGISQDTRELINSIPRMEKRIEELEGLLGVKEEAPAKKSDIPEKDYRQYSKYVEKRPVDMVEEWHSNSKGQDEEGEDAEHEE